MRRRGFVVALALLAAALYITWREFIREDREERKTETVSRVFDFRPEEVTAVTMTRPGGTVLLRSGPSGWTLASGEAADREEVAALLQTLLRVKQLRTVEEEVEEGSRFGLSPPALEVSVEIGPKSAGSLAVGGRSPAGDEWFAERAGSRSVVLVSQEAGDLLETDPASFSRKTLFHIEAERLNRITLERQRDRLVFARDEEGWKEITGGRLADEGKVLEIALMLMKLQAIPGQGSISGQVDPGAARATIRLEASGSEPVEVRVYGPIGEGRLRIRIGESGVEEVEGSLETVLTRPAAAWLSRRLARLNRFDATRVSVAVDDGRSIDLEKKGESFVVAESERTVPADRVLALLVAAFDSDVEPGAGLRAAAFGPPRLTVVATVPSGRRVVEFGAERPPGRVLARSGAREGTVGSSDYARMRAAAEELLTAAR